MPTSVAKIREAAVSEDVTLGSIETVTEATATQFEQALQLWTAVLGADHTIVDRTSLALRKPPPLRLRSPYQLFSRGFTGNAFVSRIVSGFRFIPSAAARIGDMDLRFPWPVRTCCSILAG